MGNKTRTCILCGKEYRYCPTCDTNSPAWMMNFDKDECRNIFDVLSKHTLGKASAKDVKSVLDVFPTADYTQYPKRTQTHIQDVLSEVAKGKKKNKKTIVENPDVTVSTVEVATESTNEAIDTEIVG